MSSIREQVKSILSKPFEDYNLNDIVQASNLKSQLGQQVAQAEADYLYAEQTRKKEYAKYMILSKQDWGTKADREAEATLHIADLKAEEIKAYADYKAKKLFYDDLSDQVTAMRMCNRIYQQASNDG